MQEKHENKEAVISLKNVCVYKDEERAIMPLDDVCLDIFEGEFVCLLGKQNCGKSTLLSVIGGKLMPDSGEALMSGEIISGAGSANPMILTPIQLSPWIDLSYNIELLCKIKNNYNDAKKAKVKKYIELLELEKYMNKKPYEVTEDIKFYVAFARALLEEPKIIIMDDPLFHFDPVVRIQTHKRLKRICSQLGVTVIFATRNIDEALRMATKVVVMERHGGKIAKQFYMDEKINFNEANDIRTRIYEYFISE